MVVRGAEPREVRAGMTRLTTVGRKGMKCLQNISRQNRSGGDRNDAGTNTPCRSVSLNKRHRKEIQTHHRATEGARVPENVWMTRDYRGV